MAEFVYEKKGGIAYITFNRPERMNAISPDTWIELHRRLEDFEDDPNLLVVIVTGAGDKAFSAGGDLKRHYQMGEAQFSTDAWIQRFWYPKTEPIMPYSANGMGVWRTITKPVIAAINGYCLGGALIWLCQYTDIRVAAEHAKFGFTEHKRGLGGAAGPLSRLTHQIPFAIAMEMLLLGEMMDAKEAYRIGLVNKVVPLSELMPTAEDYARRICEIPSIVARAVKEGTIREWRGEIPYGFAGRYAQGIATMVVGGTQAKEGLKAFVEKRKPKFD